MRGTSRKLKRLIESEERLESRISQLQEELKIVRESRKKEEELEMVRSIRGLKLEAKELFDLLEGIQDGTVSLEMQQPMDSGQADEEVNVLDGTEDKEETEDYADRKENDTDED